MFTLATITGLNWAAITESAASVVMAIIALFALKNWQKQDCAKREAEFLDALTEATLAYVVEIPKPTTQIQMARIGMMSQVSSYDDGSESEKVAKGAIDYILANGERDSKRLRDALDILRPISIKLRALGIKGQIFNFKNYHICFDAIAKLSWQFDRMEAFAMMIGSPSFNWDNPEVQRSLTNVLTVEHTDIQKYVHANQLEILKFAQKSYARMYD